MKRAGIYGRVSTAGQEEEQTIESQLAEVKERIKSDGNQLLAECIYLDDGWSGDLLERPELDRMRCDAEAGVFDVLYAYDRGRLARKYVYQEIVIEELEKHTREFISLHDVKVETLEDKMAQGVMGLFHEYEKVKITERFRRGKLFRVQGGKLLGYNPPFGYDYHPRIKKGANTRDGYFTINKKEAAVVKLMFEWVGNEGISIKEVIRRLHKHGIMPKKQKRDTWTNGPTSRLLQNETYIGNHYYNKTESVLPKTRKKDEKYRKILKSSRKKRPKEEWIMIKVPPIIDKGLFDRTQIELGKYKKYSRRNNSKNNYLLTGLIYCDCGKTRTGEGITGHTYYRCTDRLSKFPLPRECYKGGVSAQILDALVWQQISQLLNNPKLIEKQAERWLKSRTLDEQQTSQRGLESELEQIALEESRYAKAFGEGIMSDSVFRERMKSIESKRKSAEGRQSELDKVETQAAIIDVETLSTETPTVIAELDFEERKTIVRNLITKIIATQEEATVWGHLPVTSQSKVGLNAEHRYCWPTQCG